MGLDYKGKFIGDLFYFVNEEIPREWKRRQINTIVFLYKRLTHYTPIVSGKAITNWRVTFGTVRGNVIKGGTKENPKGPASPQEVMVNLTNMVQGELSGMKAGQTIWVYNNVHYIQALEDGNVRDPANRGYMVLRSTAETRDYISTMDYGVGGKGKVMTTRQFEEIKGF